MFKKWIPNDKVVSPPPTTAAPKVAGNEGRNTFWGMVEQIEGLDVSIGLSRIGGQQEVYKKMLELMLHEIEKSDKNLKEFLSAKDINGFRIEVHGMKSSLANIGSMALSEKAFDLENASRNEDMDFCAANIPAFLEKLNSLNFKLKEAFDSIK